MQPFQPLGKLLVVTGVILVVLGLLFLFFGKIPFLGKLPGDFYIRGKHFSLYFPLATSILLSLLISLILYLFRK